MPQHVRMTAEQAATVSAVLDAARRNEAPTELIGAAADYMRSVYLEADRRRLPETVAAADVAWTNLAAFRVDHGEVRSARTSRRPRLGVE